MKRILLVEDELILGETIVKAVQKMKFQVDWVRTLKDAKKSLNKSVPDLVLLDWNLPDGSGTDLLKLNVRRETMVLMLSAKSSLDARVTGLNLGADDYLGKPFSFDELEARIQALLRRAVRKEAKATHSDWSLSLETMTLRSPNGSFELTPLEFKFMTYLLERRGTIVSKDRLLKDVWGFSFLPKTRTVDYLINQLRKRIEPDPEKPIYLLTVRGAGVRLQA